MNQTFNGMGRSSSFSCSSKSNSFFLGVLITKASLPKLKLNAGKKPKAIVLSPEKSNLQEQSACLDLWESYIRIRKSEKRTPN